MDSSELNLKLTRKTLPEQFAFQIEELIQNSSLSPGSQLPGERELAAQYNLSRSVIREALGILQARGLVHSKPGKGTFITHLTIEDSVQAISRCLKFSDPPATKKNLTEIRLALETAAAAGAAENPDEVELEHLRKIIAVLSEPGTSDNDFIKKDLEFHLAVGKASGNSFFSVMIESITGLLHDFMKEAFAKNIQNVRPYVLEKHATILECIEKHDPAGARKAMREHIETVSQ